MTAIALMLCAGVSAQVAAQTQQQSQTQTQTQAQTQTQDQQQTQDRVRDQERLKDGSGKQASLSKEEKNRIKAERKAQKMAQKKETHGRVVSETARSTEPGPGKGEVVRTQARTQGQAQQARTKENNSVKNQPAIKGARGNAGQNRTGAPARGGAGRK